MHNTLLKKRLNQNQNQTNCNVFDIQKNNDTGNKPGVRARSITIKRKSND